MKIIKIGQVAAAALLASAGAAAWAQTGGGAAPQPGGGAQKQAPMGGGGAGGGPAVQPGGGQGETMRPGGGAGGGKETLEKRSTGEERGGVRRSEEKQRPGMEKATPGKEQQRTGGAKEGTTKQRAGEAGEKQKGAGGGVGARPDLSAEQKTQIKQRLSGGPKAENVNVSISVGTRLPRTVEIRPLPAAIIEIVPQYRGYYYVIVRDEIVIVDPDTLVIVAVIEV